MSLLVEIAARADVPLESVVRVLTREPVRDDDKSRVLAVLDHLDADERRVLQRFALAAVHDELPRAVDQEAVVAELVDDPLDRPEAVRLEPSPRSGPRGEEIEEAEFAEAPAPAAMEPAPLAQLASVLGELSEAVRELRRETDAERRERVDDLAVLIDLITKGWEGVDRRLGRVEGQLARLEAPAGAAAIEPPLVPTPPEPAPEAVPPPPPPPDDDRSGIRRRLPLIAALLLGLALGALAALDLPDRFDAAALTTDPAQEAARRTLPPTAPPGSTTPETATTAAAETSAAERTAAGTTARAAEEPAPPTQPRTTSTATTTSPPPRPRTTERAATTPARQTAPAPPGFTPSRNWAWPPVQGADYYLVEFFRGDRVIHTARPTAARVTLPASLVFSPGNYRWRVRPGRGAPAANRLDPPVVDSRFAVR